MKLVEMQQLMPTLYGFELRFRLRLKPIIQLLPKQDNFEVRMRLSRVFYVILSMSELSKVIFQARFTIPTRTLISLPELHYSNWL